MAFEEVCEVVPRPFDNGQVVCGGEQRFRRGAVVHAQDAEDLAGLLPFSDEAEEDHDDAPYVRSCAAVASDHAARHDLGLVHPVRSRLWCVGDGGSCVPPIHADRAIGGRAIH